MARNEKSVLGTNSVQQFSSTETISESRGKYKDMNGTSVRVHCNCVCTYLGVRRTFGSIHDAENMTASKAGEGEWMESREVKMSC